jgi:hypothetical protein
MDMRKPAISEWMWRFIALAMLVIVGWMAWVLYQLNPPPLILDAAFQALASARAKGHPLPTSRVEGLIKPAATSAASTTAVSPAAETPKPAPEKPAPAMPNSAEIIETVEAWARAWSTRDVAAYLAFYAKDFQTPGGEPRAQWESNRRQRISAPKTITISIDVPTVTVVTDDQVNVTFRQGYRSDIVVSSPAIKTLAMVRSEGRWLIQRETVNN